MLFLSFITFFLDGDGGSDGGDGSQGGGCGGDDGGGDCGGKRDRKGVMNDEFTLWVVTKQERKRE